MRNKSFNCDCFCCSNLNVCGIFRRLREIEKEYNFCAFSELFDSIGRICKFYKTNAEPEGR